MSIPSSSLNLKLWGCLSAYVRSDSDLPCDRKKKLEFNLVESINIEILIADKING